MAISKDLKERWIARLESPEAKWAGGNLYDCETGGMCCLGHLADLQGDLVLSGNGLLIVDEHGTEVESDRGILTYLHPEECDDLGCRISVNVGYGLTEEEQDKLAEANDDFGRFPIDMIRALPLSDEGAS